MKLRLVIALVLAAAMAPAVDQTLLGLVMPDARTVAGVDVQRSVNSPFGRYLLTQVQDDEGFKKFIADTGFDPRQDLREVVIASTSAQAGGKGNGMVIAKGTFNKARIFDEAKKHNAVLTSYKGVDILKGGSAANEEGVGFLDAGTVVAGSVAHIQAAVDRRGSKPSFDAGLQKKLVEVSGNDAWFVSIAAGGALPGGMPAIPGAPSGNGVNNALQGIQQTAGGVTFGANVMISVEALTRSMQDATALADVIRFVAGMVTMNNNNPQANRIAPLLGSMVVSTQASTVKISLSIPENDLEQLVKPQAKPRTSRKSATI